MNKKKVRALYKEKRKHIPLSKRVRDMGIMMNHFVSLDFPNAFDSYFLSYMPLKAMGEFDPTAINQYLLNKGMKMALPRIKDNDSFDAIEATDESNYAPHDMFGMEEPTSGRCIPPCKINMVLTPCILFDRLGFRVGYGKGMYDRYFAQLSRSCAKISFAFFSPLQKISDVTNDDQKISIGITPEGIYSFV